MPLFKKLLNKRLRSAEEGADTILWLATTQGYPNGKFWFDRKQAKTTIFNLNKSSKQEDELLWKYCESIFASIKAISMNLSLLNSLCYTAVGFGVSFLVFMINPF